MKLSIEGTPTEIKNALQAICGSEERESLTVRELVDKAGDFLSKKSG